MPQEKSAEHKTARARQHPEPRASHTDHDHDSGQTLSSFSESPLPTSMLSDHGTNASCNQPVRTAVMRQMQQTYGNRAVQRSLAGLRNGESAPRSYHDQVVQRWEASRQTRISVQRSADSAGVGKDQGYEHDARPVAEQVMNTLAMHAGASPVQRETTIEGAETEAPVETGGANSAPLSLQLKEIKSSDGTVKGEYDGLSSLESSYQSEWEDEKKAVGVSYWMTNAREPNGTPVTRGVAHAHVKGNGKVIAGVSAKRRPGGGETAKWVPPSELSGVTASEITGEMLSLSPTPQEITNIRKVSMVTNTWSAPHQSVPGVTTPTKLNETVYIAEPGGFVQEKKLSAEFIYDAASGVYLSTDMFATREEAEAAGLLMPMPVAPPATVTPPATVAPPVTPPSVTTTDPEAEKAKKAKKAKKAEKAKKKRQKMKEKAKASKAEEPASAGHSQEPAKVTTPATTQPSASTNSLRAWVSWAASFITG